VGRAREWDAYGMWKDCIEKRGKGGITRILVLIIKDDLIAKLFTIHDGNMGSSPNGTHTRRYNVGHFKVRHA
jgi:hypothetical protein